MKTITLSEKEAIQCRNALSQVALYSKDVLENTPADHEHAAVRKRFHTIVIDDAHVLMDEITRRILNPES